MGRQLHEPESRGRPELGWEGRQGFSLPRAQCDSRTGNRGARQGCLGLGVRYSWSVKPGDCLRAAGYLNPEHSSTARVPLS